MTTITTPTRSIRQPNTLTYHTSTIPTITIDSYIPLYNTSKHEAPSPTTQTPPTYLPTYSPYYTTTPTHDNAPFTHPLHSCHGGRATWHSHPTRHSSLLSMVVTRFPPDSRHDSKAPETGSLEGRKEGLKRVMPCCVMSCLQGLG